MRCGCFHLGRRLTEFPDLLGQAQFVDALVEPELGSGAEEMSQAHGAVSPVRESWPRKIAVMRLVGTFKVRASSTGSCPVL